MFNLTIIIGLSVLSYILGCFSTARILAKSFKHLNISKIGTGLPDITNIYSNVSKPLGVLAAAIDIAKMSIYVILLKYLLKDILIVNENHLEIIIFNFGFFMLLGHCLPITNGFKGGRGIFTYVGLLLVFIPKTMLVLLIFILLIIIFFKQFRFIQYMIVLLPPLIYMFFPESDRLLLTLMSITAVIMGILNIIVSKRLGEI